MVIFVYGDDEVRVREKLQELRERFLAKFDTTGLNLAEFPAAGTSQLVFSDVAQAIGSAPFLSQKRMVVVRGLFDGLKKAEAKTWATVVASVPESTILVLVDIALAKDIEKHELFIQLKEQAEVHAYVQAKLEGVALARSVIERAKAMGGVMTLDVATELIARVGDDMSQLQHEVEKLVAYAGGSPITRDVVDVLVSANAESNVFACIDAISQRDTRSALRLLQKERAAGAADLYILAMLARQVRILLQVQALSAENPNENVAKALGLHPFVAQKAAAQAKRFDGQILTRLHEMLAKFDAQAKYGAIDPALAVDRVVAEMAAV